VPGIRILPEIHARYLLSRGRRGGDTSPRARTRTKATARRGNEQIDIVKPFYSTRTAMPGPRFRSSFNDTSVCQERQRAETGSPIDRNFESASNCGEPLAFDVISVLSDYRITCERVPNISPPPLFFYYHPRNYYKLSLT
jgi:hypothetical protein